LRALILVVAAFAALSAKADEGAAFLKLGTGPRATALGGAYTALGDDAASIAWNPAGLARMDKREATAAHAELVERTHFDFAAYAQPTKTGTFAAGLLYLSHGSFDGRDAAGKPTGKVTAADTALSAAYANKSDWADYGVAIKFITSHIAEAQAQTAALDFGLKREVYALKGGKVYAAGAIRNLNVGPGLRYAGGQKTDLPLQIAAGGAWVHERGALSFDLMNGPNGSGTDASFGGEYHVVKTFVVRAGYGTAGLIAGGSGFDAMRGLSFGIGFKTERVAFDYAVTPAGDLGQAHRFGVGVRF
jgi:long-subunit fatty acid transport protein